MSISNSLFFVISYLQYCKNLETKVYPKCIKIALRRSKFPKIFLGRGGGMPPEPPRRLWAMPTVIYQATNCNVEPPSVYVCVRTCSRRGRNLGRSCRRLHNHGSRRGRNLGRSCFVFPYSSRATWIKKFTHSHSSSVRNGRVLTCCRVSLSQIICPLG